MSMYFLMESTNLDTSTQACIYCSGHIKFPSPFHPGVVCVLVCVLCQTARTFETYAVASDRLNTIICGMHSPFFVCRGNAASSRRSAVPALGVTGKAIPPTVRWVMQGRRWLEHPDWSTRSWLGGSTLTSPPSSPKHHHVEINRVRIIKVITTFMRA